MDDTARMRLALRLAKRGYGTTSPNPMVGAVLVKRGTVIGRSWHKKAGEPHAEIEAIRDAQKRGHSAKGATLHVTLEPCSTQGRTPPCTKAIIAAGIRRLIVGATDPNPRHAGRAFAILRRAGLVVRTGVLEKECARLNESFNHWIVHRTPFVTVKAAMSADGKIATAAGESKWITSEHARSYAMNLRLGADAVLVGINTVLADDPSLTYRSAKRGPSTHRLRRIILDSQARTPLNAKVLTDEFADLTTVVVGERAPKSKVSRLSELIRVLKAPLVASSLDIRWLLRNLGAENVTSLLVEGGGEVNAAFLLNGLAQRVAFFYAPKIIGGRYAIPAVGGKGVTNLDAAVRLTDVEWHRRERDLLLTARITGQCGGLRRR